MRGSRHRALPSCVMCALSAEQIAGLGFEQVVHAAAVSIVVVDASGKVIHSNERGRALTAELVYALPGDERLWIACSSSPVRDQSGQIVAAVLVQTDVTERKREETRRAYLAGLLDNTEDAIIALDAKLLMTAWNRGAERLYGWTA